MTLLFDINKQHLQNTSKHNAQDSRCFTVDIPHHRNASNIYIYMKMYNDIYIYILYQSSKAVQQCTLRRTSVNVALLNIFSTKMSIYEQFDSYFTKEVGRVDTLSAIVSPSPNWVQKNPPRGHQVNPCGINRHKKWAQGVSRSKGVLFDAEFWPFTVTQVLRCWFDFLKNTLDKKSILRYGKKTCSDMICWNENFFPTANLTYSL